MFAASRKLPRLNSLVREGSGGEGTAGERCIRPGTLRKAGPEPGNLVRVAPDRLDGLGRLALGMQCLAKPGAHIDRDGAHEAHVRHAVSIGEEDAGF